MNITRFALLGLLGLATIAPASAQQSVPPPPTQYVVAPAAPVPAEKAATIRHLLTLLGTAKLTQQRVTLMLSSMKTAMPDVSPELWAKVRASINYDELVELIVPIYNRHYTQQDIDGLIAFYQTPLGQKVVSELPQISQESFVAGQQWGQQKVQEIHSPDAAGAGGEEIQCHPAVSTPQSEALFPSRYPDLGRRELCPRAFAL